MAGRSAGLVQPGLRLVGEGFSVADTNWQSRIQRAGVVGSTAAATYDLVYPWGCVQNYQGWGTSGGATDPIDVLNAYPHFFPSATVIRDIIVINFVGLAGAKYKLGLYSNLGNRSPYPLAKLSEWAEQNPLPALTSQWTGLNLSVAAGTLLWLVHTCDNNPSNINLVSLPPNATSGPLILGMDPTFMTQDPLCGWSHPRTYDGTLPAQFPTSAPAPVSVTTHVPPALFCRFG